MAYMCSILLQLAPGSRDLSQAEKRIRLANLHCSARTKKLHKMKLKKKS